jgi:hypothetical protein
MRELLTGRCVMSSFLDFLRAGDLVYVNCIESLITDKAQNIKVDICFTSKN